MKAIKDDNLKVVKMMVYVLDRVEKIVGKGENAGYQHFLLFLQCFQKPFSSRSLKVGIVWEKVKSPPYMDFHFDHKKRTSLTNIRKVVE